jgi:hypothetical protein
MGNGQWAKMYFSFFKMYLEQGTTICQFMMEGIYFRLLQYNKKRNHPRNGFIACVFILFLNKTNKNSFRNISKALS